MKTSVKNIFYLFLCAIAVFVYIAVLYKITPFTFQTNDDRYINDVLSGAISGHPDPHAVYISYPLGLILSAFYKLSAAIPWYGLTLLLIHWLSFTSVIYRIISKSTAFFIKALSLLLIAAMIVALENRQLILIQYTSSATLAAAAALFLFFTHEEAKNSVSHAICEVISYALIFISIALRPKAFFILLPLAALMFIAKVIIEAIEADVWPQFWQWVKSGGKDRLLKLPISMFYVRFTLITFGIIALVCGIDYLGYSSDEWREFKAYTKARETVVDYAGYPPYEEFSSTYEEIGITPVTLEAMREHYYLVGVDIDAGLMGKIAKASKIWAKQSPRPVFDVVKQALFMKYDMMKTMSRLLLLAYVSTLGATLLFAENKKIFIGNLISLALFNVGLFISWCYLVYKGRLLERVTLPLILTEFFIMLAIILNIVKTKIDAKYFRRNAMAVMRGLWAFGMAVVFAMILYAGNGIYRDISGTARQIAASSQSLLAFNEYAADHPDDQFFADNFSFAYFYGTILDVSFDRYQNYVNMGGWLVKSPLINQKLKNKDRIWTKTYAVFLEDEEVKADWLWRYLENGGGYEHRLADTIDAQGCRFLVYEIF